MKKFFTIAALLALGTGASMAQNASFKVQGKPVENGSTVTINAHVEYYDGEVDNIAAEPELFVVVKEEGIFRMSVEVFEEEHPWEYSWCGFGNGSPLGTGLCIIVPTGKVFEPKMEYNVDAGEYDCVFHIGQADLSLTKSSSKAKFRIWDTASDAPAFEFTLVSVLDAAGVEGVAAEGVTVNGNVITAEGAIEVYNLQGALVLTAEGQADLGTLDAGVYVYRAAGHTGKVSVK